MYKSIEEFKNNCTLFSAAEKNEIINEALDFNINVLDYIEHEIQELKKVNRMFNSQKNLI